MLNTEYYCESFEKSVNNCESAIFALAFQIFSEYSEKIIFEPESFVTARMSIENLLARVSEVSFLDIKMNEVEFCAGFSDYLNLIEKYDTNEIHFYTDDFSGQNLTIRGF